MQKKGTVFTCRSGGKRWLAVVRALLRASGLDKALKAATATKVVIKPNLVEALKPPVTTPVELVEAIAAYVQEAAPKLEVVIAEGCGAADYDTQHAFDELGYTELAKRKTIPLVDLNKEPCRRLTNSSLRRWPEMYLPDIIMDSFVISVPVLKAHSLSGVTLTMKNMMGAAPPERYQAGGHWKKSAFHERMQDSVLDLNRYRTPDFTVLDATVGMAEAHLWGPVCDPPPGRVAAGFDPVAIDAYGCRLLGWDWRNVGHISGADGVLGTADPLEVREVSVEDG